MSIDTNNEKLSLISYLQPWNTPIPISTGRIEQDDKQHLIWGYAGILWSAIPFDLSFLSNTVSPPVEQFPEFRGDVPAWQREMAKYHEKHLRAHKRDIDTLFSRIYEICKNL